MSEITNAIKARQTQIAQLQSDIETLQRAASIVGAPRKPAAKAKPRQKSKAKSQPLLKSKAKPKATQKRHQWSAAQKAAIGKRRKPSAPAAASPAQRTATQKRKRAPMSVAAKKAMSKRLKAYWAKRRKARR